MLMKRLLSAMLVLILMLTLVVTVALADEGKKSGAFTYQIKGNGTATIIGYDWDTMKGRDIFICRIIPVAYFIPSVRNTYPPISGP